ncbi:MAG TPA: choice-of-anchor tandem repeat GloVer-containing protein, partial [Candidatus Sulfotelmatobacter sp.]
MEARTCSQGPVVIPACAEFFSALRQFKKVFAACALLLAALLPAVASAQVPVITEFFGFPVPGTGIYPDGRAPTYPVIQASDGNFYGTTPTGGNDGIACATDCVGTVFKLTPDGQATVLYHFAYGSSSAPYANGSTPEGGLVEGPDGYLYGTTYAGGFPHQRGIVYKISKSGAFQKLHDFCETDCSDGENPKGSLVLGSDGNFYGTTWRNGTIFRISPSGDVFTTLVNFSKESKVGVTPSYGLVQASDGNFYGVTTEGVYQMTPTGGFTGLYELGSSVSDGLGTVGPLIQATDGNLYGVTFEGGVNGVGTVFKIGLAGGFQKILDLVQASEGRHPSALLQATDGNLWGTTSNAGDAN